MEQEEFAISISFTDEAIKLRSKLNDLEKRINAITVQLCDETDLRVIQSLKKERNDLDDEKKFVARARKAEPIKLNISGEDVITMLEQAKAKEDAEEREKNSHN